MSSSIEDFEELSRDFASGQEELGRAKQLAQDKEAELADLKSQVEADRRNTAIRGTIAGMDFIDENDVIHLTSRFIKYDSDGNIKVVGEDGALRYGRDLRPLSIRAFYTEFADKKPQYVRGNTRTASGTGVSISKPDITVEEIFGRGSSVKAQGLFKSDPAEYKRLKVIARSKGLV